MKKILMSSVLISNIAIANILYHEQTNLMILNLDANHSTRTNWENGKKYCENLTFNGYSNWRLPTNTELLMIFSDDDLRDKIEQIHNGSWSNEEDILHPSKAWDIFYSTAAKSIQINSIKKTAQPLVRCVRDLKPQIQIIGFTNIKNELLKSLSEEKATQKALEIAYGKPLLKLIKTDSTQQIGTFEITFENNKTFVQTIDIVLPKPLNELDFHLVEPIAIFSVNDNIETFKTIKLEPKSDYSLQKDLILSTADKKYFLVKNRFYKEVYETDHNNTLIQKIPLDLIKKNSTTDFVSSNILGFSVQSKNKDTNTTNTYELLSGKLLATVVSDKTTEKFYENGVMTKQCERNQNNEKECFKIEAISDTVQLDLYNLPAKFRNNDLLKVRQIIYNEKISLDAKPSNSKTFTNEEIESLIKRKIQKTEQGDQKITQSYDLLGRLQILKYKDNNITIDEEFYVNGKYRSREVRGKNLYHNQTFYHKNQAMDKNTIRFNDRSIEYSFGENGVLLRENNYIIKDYQSKLDGPQKEYFSDGVLAEEYNCIVGEYQGEYKIYYPNGNLRSTEFYDNGSRVKNSLQYYDPIVNAKPIRADELMQSFEISDEKGVLTKVIMADGLLYRVERYENGLLDGEQISFNAISKIVSWENYKLGIKHGIQKREDGVELLYENGDIYHLVDGFEYDYNRRGGIYQERFYKNNKLEFANTYEDNGNIDEQYVYLDNYYIRIDYSDGYAKTLYTLSFNNQYNGERIEWFDESPQIRQVGNYKNGDPIGIFTQFYPSGKLKGYINHLGNSIIGDEEYFYENGNKRLVIKKEYSNGLPSANITSMQLYFEDGSKQANATALNDKSSEIIIYNQDQTIKYYLKCENQICTNSNKGMTK